MYQRLHAILTNCFFSRIRGVKDLEAYRSYSRRRWTISCVVFQLSSKTEVRVSQVIRSWVFGPYARERLTYGAEVLLNRSLYNILAASGQYSISRKMCENRRRGMGSLMERRCGCNPIQTVICPSYVRLFG